MAEGVAARVVLLGAAVAVQEAVQALVALWHRIIRHDAAERGKAGLLICIWGRRRSSIGTAGLGCDCFAVSERFLVQTSTLLCMLKGLPGCVRPAGCAAGAARCCWARERSPRCRRDHDAVCCV
jgi:hypothetical protein